MNLRDFEDSGALKLLSERFSVDFLYIDEAIGESLRAYGTLRYRHRNPRQRYWLWNCASTIDSLGKYSKLVGGMDRRFFNRKSAGKEYWHWSVRLGEALYRIGLGVPASAFMKWLLNLSAGVPFRARRPEGYAAVVLPTVLRDTAAEDLVRWARRAGIPSVAVQGNWDCFNLKQMLVEPDHFLVWGEQSWYFARILHHLPHRSLRVIGSQRHDHYFRKLPSKAAAREKIGVAGDDPVILFCGVIAAFNEQEALRAIDAAISDGSLPRNLRILYKPHPRSSPAQGALNFDSQGYKHVRVAAFPGLEMWNSLEEYEWLLRAVDATISPYSTMGLESALCGRPTLCLGYHTDAAIPYWSYAREFLHIQSYRFLPWAVHCERHAELVASVSRLLDLARNPSIEQQAIDSTIHMVYRDGLPYAERLCAAIEGIVAAESGMIRGRMS